MKTAWIIPLFFPLLVQGCAATATSSPPSPSPSPGPNSVTVPLTSTPNQPENETSTYVKKLDEPTEYATAVDKLAALFEDALVRDNEDRNGPKVKPLREQIVPPLVRACVVGEFEPRTQTKLLKLIAETRDPRGGPCFVKTLDRYAPETTDEDVRIAARAVGLLHVKEAAGPLFKVFTTMSLSKPQGALIYRDINESIVALSDPSWEAPCITILDKPIADRENIDAYKDALFRHVTCAQVLGNLKSEKGIPSLIRVVLSPIEVESAATAINALIKIGKPAVLPLTNILRGNDKALIDFAKREYMRAHTEASEAKEVQRDAPMAYLHPTAMMLGSIGRDDAAATMLDVMKRADPRDKVVLARELLKLPHTSTTVEAVKRIYEKIPYDLNIPPGINGRSTLIEQFGYTFDAELVPWMIKETLAQKGSDENLEELRGNTLVAAMKLAKFEQVDALDKLARLPDSAGSTIGKGFENELAVVKGVTAECRNDLACYFRILADPRAHKGEGQFRGIKAAYMIGVLGSPNVRAKMMEMLPNMSGIAARFVSVQVIDHFSPRGDVGIGDELQKLYDEAQASNDANRRVATMFYLQFANRLRARAQ